MCNPFLQKKDLWGILLAVSSFWPFKRVKRLQNASKNMISKKWHFERPDLTTDSKNLAKHPPKWFIRHLVHAFSIFWASIKPIFENHVLRGVLEAFYPLKRPKTRNRWPSEENAPKIIFLQKWVAYI